VKRGQLWLIAIVALVGAASLPSARAQDAEGHFEVRNAYIELVNGVWQLDVSLDLALADAAKQAFEEGVPLVVKLDVEASVQRRILPADDIVETTREWQLAYDAIAERFVVTDSATGAHISHATQAEALEALTRISGIAIADTTKLPEKRRFDMRVRATVEIGELPAAVRLLLFWKNWSRTTDWYEWKVRP
jgi:hypothetical protein